MAQKKTLSDALKPSPSGGRERILDTHPPGFLAADGAERLMFGQAVLRPGKQGVSARLLGGRICADTGTALGRAAF